MARDVFICHSSQDRGVANAVCSAIEQAGVPCWIAPRDPVPGIAYARQIVEAIEAAKIVVLIFSDPANRSEHVARELETAINSGATIVPFRITDIHPSAELQYYITRIHWLDAFVPPMEPHIAMLVDRVRALLEGAPVPATAAAAAVAPVSAPSHDLPEQLSSLIGRDDEVAEIEALLSENRIVTVAGPGGVGKTSTVLQVSHDALPRYADGAWWVDLSAIDAPDLVPSTIATVLGIADDGERPLVDQLVLGLKKRRLLLVLDNCEQVVASVATAVERIAHGCRDVTVLATTREPLGIAGEALYRMPALPVPPKGVTLTAEQLMTYGAAALFVTRARAAQRTFAVTDANAATVADIVRRLDGIALAIELAAARIKVLNVRQLDERLDQRFKLLSGGKRTGQASHQTLYALIGWSYDLLSEAERSMLRQLAVFSGGWSLEAAESICIDDRYGDWDALELLSSLVDKSLVIAEEQPDGEERYRMLESTRQFAADRLDEAAERDGVAERHRAFFSGLARQALDDYWTAPPKTWARASRLDLENLRAAIESGLRQCDDPVAAATIVVSLRDFWTSVRAEGRTQLQRAAAALDAGAPAGLKGVLELLLSDFDAATLQMEHLERALEFSELGDDEPTRIQALGRRAAMFYREGRIAECVAEIASAEAAARAFGNRRLMYRMIAVEAAYVSVAGDRARARALLDEAEVLVRTSGEPNDVASFQLNLATVLFAENDVAGALACAREAVEIFRACEPTRSLSIALQFAIQYLVAAEHFDAAADLAGESLSRALEEDDEVRTHHALEFIAHVAAETGDPVASATLIAFTDAFIERIHSVRDEYEERRYQQTLRVLERELPAERRAALRRLGASMPLDQAVAVARAHGAAMSERAAPRSA